MKIVFLLGKIVDKSSLEVEDILKLLKIRSEWMHDQRVDDLIEFFDQVSRSWKNDKVLIKQIGPTLIHLARFLEAKNLKQILGFALRGNYHVLDDFMTMEYGSGSYHCQPRGLALHWLSGNAPLLGFYSLVQSMLTKNVAIVKPSKRAYKELLLLLASMSTIETRKIKGKELLSTLVVVLLEHEEIEAMRQISMQADIRVAWGGEEAVKTVLSLEKRYFCEDIIFGPKYSYGVVAKSDRKDWGEITKRIAFDICTFDQYACSSPNVIFLEKGDKTTLIKFAGELSKALNIVTQKFLPKQEKDIAKNLEILTLRTKYAMVGKIFKADNLDWTVIVRAESALPQACHSRVIYIQPLKNWNSVVASDRGKQTLGVSSSMKKKTKILDLITRKGIDRIVIFGDMTLFASPWDGMFAVDRMVRWVSICN